MRMSGELEAIYCGERLQSYVATNNTTLPTDLSARCAVPASRSRQRIGAQNRMAVRPLFLSRHDER